MSNDYIIAQYGPNGPFDIAAGQVDNTLSLKLLGRGAPGYGQIFAENTVKQLANFANTTAPSGTILQGQLWFDTSTTTLKVYSGSTWHALFGESNTSSSTPMSVTQGGTGISLNGSDANLMLQVNSTGTGYNLVSISTLASELSGNLPYVNTNTGLVPSAGNAYQYPQVNSAGTAYNFITAASLASDLTASLTNNFVPTSTNLVPNSSVANQYLQVKSDGSGFQYVTASQIATAVNGGASYLRSDVTSGPTVDNAINLGGSGDRFANVYAVTFQGTATSAKYADVAERYEASEPLQSGDVVELGGDKEVQKTRAQYSTDVFGVVSTNPAFKMNSDAGDDETHPYIALTGRVPVKVIGAVRKGQRLVASAISGVAMAVDLDPTMSVFSILGRSLENKDTAEIGIVEVVLGAK